MRIHTASEGIRCARALETESSRFYTEMAQRYPEHATVFHSFAEENAKNVALIERTYYEAVTDAIEGSFCLALDLEDCNPDLRLADGASSNEALRKAVEIERRIASFYAMAAEQSRGLLSDLSQALAVVARKRRSRCSRMELAVPPETGLG